MVQKKPSSRVRDRNTEVIQSPRPENQTGMEQNSLQAGKLRGCSESRGVAEDLFNWSTEKVRQVGVSAESVWQRGSCPNKERWGQ